MRRFSVSVFLCLCVLFALNAQWANLLGQETGFETGYELQPSAGQSTFFDFLPFDVSEAEIVSRTLVNTKGEAVKRFDTITLSPYSATVTTDLTTGSYEAQVLQDNYLSLRLSSADGFVDTERYTYDEDGELEQIVFLRDGEMVRLDLYFRNPTAGSLALVRSYARDGEFLGDVVFFEGSVYQDRSLVAGQITLDFALSDVRPGSGSDTVVIRTALASGLVSERELDSAGNPVVRRIIDEDGQTVSVEKLEYDSRGNLIRSTLTEGDEKTVTTYAEISRTEERFSDGVLTKRTVYESERTVQTLYENGSPYAVVTFDPVTGKVKGIEYL